MSVLINGMEMPTERESFTITVKYNGIVLDTETGIQVAEAHEVPAHGIMICLDIPMPQNCGDCPCAHIFDGYTCMAAKRSFDKYALENRMDWCPITEMKEMEESK